MSIGRALSVALFLYVCLDIANPLMPGAVQFVDGTVQVVEASRSRPEAEMPVPVMVMTIRLAMIPGRRALPRVRRPRRIIRQVPRHPRSAIPRSPDSASPADH